MRILALDLATKTGWALWDGVRMESGVQDFSKSRGESNGMLFLKFNRWLAGIIDSQVWPRHLEHEGFGFCPLLLVYEAPHHRGGYATEIAVGLATRVQEASAFRNLECTPVHSMTLKKWATGSGKSDKVTMMREAPRLAAMGGRPDWQPADDNEADAVLLLFYALEKFGGVSSWSAHSASPAARSSKQENITP